MTTNEQTELLRLLADIYSKDPTPYIILKDKEKEVVKILMKEGYVSIGGNGQVKGIK